VQYCNAPHHHPHRHYSTFTCFQSFFEFTPLLSCCSLSFLKGLGSSKDEKGFQPALSNPAGKKETEFFTEEAQQAGVLKAVAVAAKWEKDDVEEHKKFKGKPRK
jgi:hypothetical protein